MFTTGMWQGGLMRPFQRRARVLETGPRVLETGPFVLEPEAGGKQVGWNGRGR